MNCSKCAKEAVYNNKQTGALCNSCFMDLIVKRVRKEIKNSGWLKKGENVLLIDDKSLESKVSIYLLKEAIGKLPVNIIIGKEDKKADRIIPPWSLERETNKLLDELFTAGSIEAEKNAKIIKLLKSISEEEIILIAKIKNIRGKLKGTNKDYISELEKRYPGSKMGLVKAMKEFG